MTRGGGGPFLCWNMTIPNAKTISTMKIPNMENNSTLLEEEPCCSGPIEKVGTGISDGVIG
jgi:hypothetical protein